MPLSADPDRLAEFSLATDRDKPAESRPVFLCRFMTRREHQKIDDLFSRALAEDDPSARWQLLRQIIEIGVVGWRNFGREFSIDAIADVLSDLEIWELARDYRFAVLLSEADLKNLSGPSGSNGRTACAAENQIAAR